MRSSDTTISKEIFLTDISDVNLAEERKRRDDDDDHHRRGRDSYQSDRRDKQPRRDRSRSRSPSRQKKRRSTSPPRHYGDSFSNPSGPQQSKRKPQLFGPALCLVLYQNSSSK